MKDFFIMFGAVGLMILILSLAYSGLGFVFYLIWNEFIALMFGLPHVGLGPAIALVFGADICILSVRANSK